MSGERWARVERIYHSALERPARDRTAFVRAAVNGDVVLAAEIEALLAYDDQPAAFMQHTAMEVAARALAALPDGREQIPSSGAIGSYDILRPLGSGGMGDVYLARDNRLARNVALKVLRPELTDPEWTAAFRQEALAASALNHPNVVTIYEIGAHEGTGFIATEYVDGITLRERLKHGSIATQELIGIALQIAEGLAAAHDAGVVHRDIKPDNVMLRADGLVKIVDFGIATRTSTAPALSLVRAGEIDRAVIGTTGYMSPEQRAGQPVDARSDVWSLGMVIYEMAIGRLPVGASTELPPQIARIVARALADEPTARHATAAELAHELRALHHQHGEVWRNRAVRARWWLGAAAAVLIAVAAYLVVSARDSRDTLGITSISVMPLKSVGEIRDGEYVADGIIATVRSRLAEVGSIRQPAPSEAARYDRLGVSPAQAGREMQVAAVLTGALERRNDTAVVRLELLRSTDGAALWRRQFVRPGDDLLTLHTEIARELMEALGLSPQRSGSTGDTTDPAAYQLYVKGRYHVQRRTPDDLRKGLAYLREAVTLDPRYGRAYAKLADGYILLAMTSDVAPKQSFPRARHAAERALAIDPGLSEARVSMGIIKFWFDWDWSGAETEFKRAIAAEPPDPAAHTFYGHLLSNLGDHTRAAQEMRRALDYEPHSALANALFGQSLYYEGRYDASLAHLEKTLPLDPGLWLTHNMIGRIYGRKGMHREALLAFTRATQLGGSLIVTAMSGYTLAASGNRDEARRILDQLNARAAQSYVPPSNVALVHLGLGEHDKALDRLEEAVEARDMLLTFLTVEPRWASLAGHSRFTGVLGKVGLKQ